VGERLDQLVATAQIGSAFQQYPGIDRGGRNLSAEFCLGVSDTTLAVSQL